MTARLLVWLRRHGAALLLLVAAAAVYASTLSSFGMFTWDEAEYAALSRSLLRGEGFHIGGAPNALRPPLLPLAGAASMWLRGEVNDRSAKEASVALALVALALVYAITSAALDRSTALFAAFLLATMPEFWTMTAHFFSEIPFLAFFAAAVLGFDLGLRRDPRWFWVAWPAWALAMLTRYTAVLFAPFVVLRLVAAVGLRRDEEWPRLRAPAFLLAPAAGLALLAPWLLRQQWAFGDVLIGFRQASQQLQIYAPEVSMPWHFYLVRLPELLSPATTLLLLLGVAWAVWRRHGPTLNASLVIGGLLLWFSAYRYKELRLITSILPFAAVVAAAGIAQILPGRARLLLVPLAAAIFWWNHSLVQPVFENWLALGYPPFLEAMELVRGRSSPEAVVLGANTPQIAWYADRRIAPFPAAEEELASSLSSAEWVVFSNFERGQPAYASALAKRLLGADAPEDVVTFRDRRWAVLVARSAVVASHAETRALEGRATLGRGGS